MLSCPGLVRRMMHAAVAASFARWCENVRELHRQRGVMERVMLRMTNAGMLAALQRWRESTTEKKAMVTVSSTSRSSDLTSPTVSHWRGKCKLINFTLLVTVEGAPGPSPFCLREWRESTTSGCWSVRVPVSSPKPLSVHVAPHPGGSLLPICLANR